MTATAPRAPSGGVAAEPGWGHAAVRASGVVLAVLLAVHLLDAFVWHDVGATTAQTFGDRWTHPAWRAFDWAFVVLGLVHGTIGLRPVIDSGIRRPRLRGVLSALLYTMVALLVAFVTLVAATYRF